MCYEMNARKSTNVYVHMHVFSLRRLKCRNSKSYFKLKIAETKENKLLKANACKTYNISVIICFQNNWDYLCMNYS